jgi:hypothetical protein
VTNIAILAPNIFSGDAVSNDAVGMFKSLKSEGYNTAIFTPNRKKNDDDLEIYPVEDLERFVTGRYDVILYHFCMGWRLGLDLLKKAICIKIIKYHNITPAVYFDEINKDYFDACEVGRKQLLEFPEIDDCYFISDSAYNSCELRNLGLSGDRCFVLPPFHSSQEL